MQCINDGVLVNIVYILPYSPANTDGTPRRIVVHMINISQVLFQVQLYTKDNKYFTSPRTHPVYYPLSKKQEVSTSLTAFL